MLFFSKAWVELGIKLKVSFSRAQCLKPEFKKVMFIYYSGISEFTTLKLHTAAILFSVNQLI